MNQLNQNLQIDSDLYSSKNLSNNQTLINISLIKQSFQNKNEIESKKKEEKIEISNKKENNLTDNSNIKLNNMNSVDIIKTIKKALNQNEKIKKSLKIVYKIVNSSSNNHASLPTIDFLQKTSKSECIGLRTINDIDINEITNLKPIPEYKEEAIIKKAERISKGIQIDYNKENTYMNLEQSKIYSHIYEVSDSKNKQIQENIYKISLYDLQKDQIVQLKECILNLKEELKESEMSRALMHKYIEETKGNIRTYLRIKSNLNKNNKVNLLIKSNKASLDSVSLQNSQEVFYFNKIFTEETDQTQVFSEIYPLIISSLDGDNITLIAYGATGSGKTYTMQGISNNIELKGILPRAAELLFSEIKRRTFISESNQGYLLQLSAIEIYNEMIYDLFSSNKDKMQVINNSIKNLTYKTITKEEEITNLIIKAGENRSIDSTEFNSSSSRSHAIYQLKLLVNNENKDLVSIINIVDLAGSEKSTYSTTQQKTNSEIEKMKKIQMECSFINKSLMTLGRIINLICKKSKEIPPYRESKLTLLLQNSLNSNSKTVLIITINNENSNSENNQAQTGVTQIKESLNFAKSAMQC